MPWFLSFLLPIIESLIIKYGVPALEDKFPGLKPLIETILKVIGGKPVPQAHQEALKASCDRFHVADAMFGNPVGQTKGDGC